MPLGINRLAVMDGTGTVLCETCGKIIHAGQVYTWNPLDPKKPRYCVAMRDENGHWNSGCWYSKCEPGPLRRRIMESPLYETGDTDSLADHPLSAVCPVTDEAESAYHPASNGHSDPLAQTLADALKPLMAQSVNADEVRSIVKRELALAPKPKLDEDKVLDLIEQALEQSACRVKIEDAATGEVKDAGVQHKRFADLLIAMQAKDFRGNRLNIWMAGPAGSGKTTAAEKAAAALNLSFYSCGAIAETYRLIGFMSPGTGAYVPTDFRRAFENGGVFLLDEVDASDPAVVLELNAALANTSYPFPDKMVARHPDFICIAAANTWGLGATNDYVGRSKMDAAFLNRFVFLQWDYDEKLERHLAQHPQWTDRVIAIRHAVKQRGIKVVISPRASIYGAALLRAKASWELAEEMALKTCMTPDQWQTVKDAK